MGISLWWVNMIDRRVGDEKVQRVILNWAEIWPNERTNINFHIVDNFTGWSYPWWWSWWWGSAFIGGDWIFSWWWQAYFDYSWFPDLSRAIRVKIVYQVYWDTTSTDVNNLVWHFYYGNNQMVQLGSWIVKRDNWNYYGIALFQGNSGQNHQMSVMPEPWNYTLTWDIRLTPRTYGSTTYPGWMDWTLSETDGTQIDQNGWMIFQSDYINQLHAANDFRLMLQPGIVVKSIDMYIYNADATPRPTWFHIPRSQEMLYMQTLYQNSGISFQSLQHYFHIPFSWYYNHNGIYKPPNDPNHWDEIWFWTTTTGHTGGSFVARWFNPANWLIRNGNPSKALHIRLVRDYPVVPDLNNHRICHVNVTNHRNPNYKCQLWWNELEGLISFTSNLVEEYPEAAFRCTIQDKNRWATEVYSERTEVTSANEGLWYQRWNNYWFPYISEVRYVSDPIDVSAYWDGIYYESSNFTCSTPNDDYAWFTPLTTPLREETTFNW